ncbi:MAG: sterol desaturase family protein [Pseudomonadota bacterium]|nr:sterol desaturase family protein [Pseudomonadota bacterium]
MEILVYPVIALVFVAIFTREVIAPASKNLCDRRWLILASCMGVLTVATTLGLGYVFSTRIEQIALFRFTRDMPDVLVGFLGFLLTSFLFYWWHRAMHASNTLWRVFHQLHHSARRLESLTAFFAHPLDTAAAVVISGVSSYLVLGASPAAAAIALLLTAGFNLFIHADKATPKWVGYIVQRPEMHTVHHAHNHHAQNYGLPIWDMLFGTWCNPPERAARLGFDTDKAERIHDMLMLRDVNH